MSNVSAFFLYFVILFIYLIPLLISRNSPSVCYPFPFICFFFTCILCVYLLLLLFLSFFRFLPVSNHFHLYFAFTVQDLITLHHVCFYFLLTSFSVSNVFLSIIFFFRLCIQYFCTSCFIFSVQGFSYLLLYFLFSFCFNCD